MDPAAHGGGTAVAAAAGTIQLPQLAADKWGVTTREPVYLEGNALRIGGTKLVTGTELTSFFETYGNTCRIETENPQALFDALAIDPDRWANNIVMASGRVGEETNST